MSSAVGGGSPGRIKTQTWMLMYIANIAEQQNDLKQMIQTRTQSIFNKKINYFQMCRFSVSSAILSEIFVQISRYF